MTQKTINPLGLYVPRQRKSVRYLEAYLPDGSAHFTLRVSNAHNDLRVVCDDEPLIPFLVKTAKHYGMWFDKGDFIDQEIECLDDHNAIFRGKAASFVELLVKCVKDSPCGVKIVPGGQDTPQ